LVSDLFNIQAPFYSSFTPAGRVFLNPGGTPNPSRTFDSNGNIIPVSTNGPAGDGVGATGFNRQDFRALAIPTTRYLFAGKGDYELAPNHRLFMEGTYSSTATQSELEPFPFSASGVNGSYPATNRVPADFLVNGVLVKNPVIPAGIYSALTPDPVTGVRYYDFTRRLSEVGYRGNDATLDTFRALVGARGTLAGWDYELYAAHGQTRRTQMSSGQVNLNSFRNALEAIPDGSGGAMCRDAEARTQGCVPVNVFGYNSITPAALAYISAQQFLSTKVTQSLSGGTVTGEPLQLPAGPLGVAAGFEYRQEKSASNPDALTQAGLNGNNKIGATTGSFDVKELFAEVRAPLLKDAFLAKSLSVSAAVRGGDYSTVGNTTSWNGGFEWAPSSDIKFRGVRSVSTRAPNIGELYQGPQQNFPSVSDPCVGVTATSAGAKDAACRADPGVSANIAANGSFKLNQADLQGTSGFDRGNPALKSEDGKSTTFGMIIAPRSLPMLNKFTFTVDYFKIDINKAIVSTPRQFLLNQCYGGDASFCAFVQRNPTAIGANSAGFLQRVDTAASNSGGISTSGLDLTAEYSDRVGPGRLNSRISYTRLINGYVIPLPGADKDHFAGEIGAPRNKASWTLGYTSGPWSGNARFSYIGESNVDDQILATLCMDNSDPCTAPGTPGSAKFSAKTYLDTQFSYTFGKAQFYLGIDNLLATKPPHIDTNNVFGVGSFGGSNSTGAGTVPDTYDAIGRRFYAGVRMKF
jgi:hypothetical protein